jgi:WD40 repeat protein
VAFAPDGQLLASGSIDKTVRLWDTASWKCVRVLKGHTSGSRAGAFSPNSQLLACGYDDGMVRVWDAASGNCLYILEGHSRYVKSVVFSPDGKHLAIGSQMHTVRIWDMGWVCTFLALILSQERPLGAELYSLIFSEFL